MVISLVRLARPRDWVKNVFVLLPVPFAVAAGTKFGKSDWTPFALGLLGFCLVNSAIYTLNDLFDAAADRLHPKKRFRPIAAGEVPVGVAWAQVVVLFAAGLLLCLAAHKAQTLTIVLAYVALNIFYNLDAKRVALLDVFFLASGFVIRVLLGCALVSAQPSAWLLLCTSTLALFLGFAKRRADVVAGLDEEHRASLQGYNLNFLDHAMTICAGVAILAYGLYCIEQKGTVLRPGREIASLPFVTYGVLNYLRMVHVEGAGGSPVDVVYRSLSMQACAIGWFLTATWSLNVWPWSLLVW
jgi:4-hydroxybenzoate polyprenyltransferase